MKLQKNILKVDAVISELCRSGSLRDICFSLQHSVKIIRKISFLIIYFINKRITKNIVKLNDIPESISQIWYSSLIEQVLYIYIYVYDKLYMVFLFIRTIIIYIYLYIYMVFLFNSTSTIYLYIYNNYKCDIIYISNRYYYILYQCI